MAFAPERNDDRKFYEVSVSRPLGKGVHTVWFGSTKEFLGHKLTVCHVMLHEYGTGYNTAPGYIGAYPVFEDPGKLIGYRPTEVSCTSACCSC